MTGAPTGAPRAPEGVEAPPPRVLTWLTWVGLIGLLLRNVAHTRTIDLDVFHAMSLFREALALGRFPLDDVFAYTPTNSPVVHHEWGTGAILYALWEGTGWGPLGLTVLRYGLLAVLLVVACACARRRGATLASIALAGSPALLMLTVGLAPVRGQMFTFVLVAVLLLFLEFDRRGARWWIPVWLVLSALWVNLHGGIVVGAGIVALTMADRFVSRAPEGIPAAWGSVRHLPLVLAGMAVVLFLTPYGSAYPHYLWRAITMERPLVSEWAALWDPRVGPGIVWAYVLSVSFIVYAVWKSGIRPGSGFPIVVALALGTLLSQRHLSLYAIAWFTWIAPALARAELGRMVARWYSRHPLQVAAVAVLCALAGVSRTIGNRSWDLVVPAVALDRGAYPVGSVDYLAARSFSGNLMTSFEDGSYVSWRLYPAVKVSLDSRYEAAFPNDVFREQVRFFAAAPGWADVLTRYETDAVLVPHDYPVAAAMESSPDVLRAWPRVYRDDTHALYVRRDRATMLGLATAPPRSRTRTPAAGSP